MSMMMDICFYDSVPESKFKVNQAKVARVVEGNERNCWNDQIHQVGLTINNTIGKFSGGGLGND